MHAGTTAEELPPSESERTRLRVLAGRKRATPARTRQSGGKRDDSRVDDDLVALLGHELRAPVSALRSSAELLVDYLDGDLNSAEAQRSVRRIYSLSMRLSSMIQDLFDLAQCLSGTVETSQVEIDLVEVVASAVEVARTLPGMPVIAVDAPVQCRTVRGDSRRLSGAVLNLLNNASQHAAETALIDVRIRESDRDVMIDVEDYGPGIHPDDLPRVFCKHFRGRPGAPVESGGTRREAGLGLGLFIVQQIVRAHNGRIEVRSAAGSGTRFTLSLPCSRP